MDAPNGVKEWLSSAPECYRNLFLDSTNPYRLDTLEKTCKFNERIQECKMTQTVESPTLDETADDFCVTESFEFFTNVILIFFIGLNNLQKKTVYGTCP